MRYGVRAHEDDAPVMIQRTHGSAVPSSMTKRFDVHGG
jgi:hypothetical protein